MNFNYEKSVWGRGTAGLRAGDPTSIRLSRALAAIQNLPSGAKVLEIGCGAGQFIRAIKKFRPELETHGVDISENAINAARTANDGVAYVVQKGGYLPYEDNYFNAVIILDVLEHAENWHKILFETKRVLKTGGIIYFFVPCEGDILSFWNWFRKIHLGANLTKKHAGHINYFSRKIILEKIRELGFVNSASFSEHFFGQLLGVAAFVAMELKTGSKGNQTNNEEYFSKTKPPKIVNYLKNGVNGLVYLESWLLQRVPSPNLHITGYKS